MGSGTMGEFSKEKWRDEYLDGMSAQEWCEWGRALQWLYGNRDSEE